MQQEVDTKLLFVSDLEGNKNGFKFKKLFQVKLVHHGRMSKKKQKYHM